MSTLAEKIASYWDKQSAIWREEKVEQWTKPETLYWTDFFREVRSRCPGGKVLEIGTASGYFANILHLAGFEVTAIDISPNMIEEAKSVSASLGIPVDYYVMNALELNFHAQSFDLVFTRLMTWTIPDLLGFYGQCHRVLRPKGHFINFDGDFGKCEFSQEGHEKYPEEIMEEANRIKAGLAVNSYDRPEKDEEILKEIGFTSVISDHSAQNRILRNPKEGGGIFMIEAVKG